MNKKTLLRQVSFILTIVFMIVMAAMAEETSEGQEQTVSTVDESKWQCILLLGEDARSDAQVERSDVNLILCISASEGKAKLISIMRDTWVDFPGMHKSGKINAGTVYGGPELTMKTVNECFGTNIEKYVLVNFENIVDFVDLLGGVDIEITEAERIQINGNIGNGDIFDKKYEGDLCIEEAGMVHMNGMMALGYVRDRHSTEAGDFDRVVRQRNLARAMLKSAEDLSVNEVIQLALGFLKNVKTNLSIAEIMALVPTAMNIGSETLEECTIPFEGTFKSGMMNGIWKIVPNFEKNQEMLHNLIYGDAA